MDYSVLFDQNQASVRPEWRIGFLLVCKLNSRVVDLVLSGLVAPLDVFLQQWPSVSDSYKEVKQVFDKRNEKKATNFIIGAGNWLVEVTKDCLLNDLAYRWRNASLCYGIIGGLKQILKELVEYNYSQKHIDYLTDWPVFRELVLTIPKNHLEKLVLVHASRLPWLIAFETNSIIETEYLSTKMTKTNLFALVIGLYHCISELRLMPKSKNLVDVLGLFKQNKYLWASCEFKIKQESQQKCLTVILPELHFGLNINQFEPFLVTDKSIESVCFYAIKQLVKPFSEVYAIDENIGSTDELLASILEETYHQDPGCDIIELLDSSDSNESAFDVLLSNNVVRLTVDSPDEKDFEKVTNINTILKPYLRPVYSNESVACLNQVKMTFGSKTLSNLLQNTYHTTSLVCIIEIVSLKRFKTFADKMIITKLVENFKPIDNNAKTVFLLNQLRISSNHKKQWSNSGLQMIVVHESEFGPTNNSLMGKIRSVLEENIYRVYNTFNLHKQNVILTLK